MQTYQNDKNEVWKKE